MTLEGIEGSGKSTQTARLAQSLRRAGYRVCVTREPGGTKIAESLRHILLSSTPREPLSPETEALVILAARSQHVTQVIKPALAEGKVVLCDRFVDSTLAYQGYGRGLDIRLLEQFNVFATGGLAPALTLLFDLPVMAGLQRRRTAGGRQNRLDRESATFHEKVRRGFRSLAKREPHRIVRIDAARLPGHVTAEAERVLFDRLKRFNIAAR